ncbi:hypothetical protein [Alteribacter natronophilus]|uniref:hypothetical protein n=1 Tax=Alteribacter natronophilus TaxID=2583810 RepID=UPI00110E62D7|nr:hypothetical protein [Alteribacter natronophilus]TMW71518.1 hypothetical protein FGB90_10790 [Alteribacter natronophilus]
MQGQLSKSIDYIRLLDNMNDNVFIVNEGFELQWMNTQAVKLVKDLLIYLPVESPEELIGYPVDRLHDSSSNFHEVIENNRLPYRKTVPIYDYIADLHADKLLDKAGDHTGYILFWRDVTKEKRNERRREKMLAETATPILPVVLENALFAPLIGTFDEERFELLRNKVLSRIEETGADYIIFDFSGLTSMEDDNLVDEFTRLRETVTLMGASAYYTGFSTKLVKAFVVNQLKVQDKTFAHYRQAIHDIMLQEGLEISEKTTKKT